MLDNNVFDLLTLYISILYDKTSNCLFYEQEFCVNHENWISHKITNIHLK